MSSSNDARTPPPSRKGSALSHASTASAASLSSLSRLVTSQLTKVLQRPAACCGDEDRSPHRRAGQAGKVVPTNRRKHHVTPAIGGETVPLDDEVRLPLTTYMQMLQLADECHARGGHRFIRGTEPHMVQSYLVDLEGLSDPEDLCEDEWELGKEPGEVNRCRSTPPKSFRECYFVMDVREDAKLREAERAVATQEQVPVVAPVPVSSRKDLEHLARLERSRDSPSSAGLTGTTNPLSPTSTEARNDTYTLNVPRVSSRRKSKDHGPGEATPRNSPSRLNTANKRWKAALTITRITARWPRPEKLQEVTSTSPVPQSPKRGLRRSVSNLSKLSAMSKLSAKSVRSQRSSITNRTGVSLPSRNSMATISSMPSNTSEQLPRHRDLQRSRIKGRGLKHNFQQEGETEGTPRPYPIREEAGGEWGEITPSGERTPCTSGDRTPSGPDEFRGRGDYSRQGSFVPSLSGDQADAQDPMKSPSPEEGFSRADSP